MDPRHESLKRAALTQLIIVINHYIQHNIDDIFASDVIYNEVQGICKSIYTFIGIEVDVDTILSKQNLLSIDMVLFPHLDDIVESQFEVNDFNHLINTIKIFTHQTDNGSELTQNIHEILNNYLSNTSA